MCVSVCVYVSVCVCMCVHVCVCVCMCACMYGSLSRFRSLAAYLDGGEMPLDGGVQHGAFLMPRLLQVPMHRKVATVHHLPPMHQRQRGKRDADLPNGAEQSRTRVNIRTKRRRRQKRKNTKYKTKIVTHKLQKQGKEKGEWAWQDPLVEERIRARLKTFTHE